MIDFITDMIIEIDSFLSLIETTMIKLNDTVL